LFTWLSFGSALPSKVAQFSVGDNMQSELDSFFAHKGGECSGAGLLRHVTDRALAKARSQLHVPALWALNAQLIQGIQDQGLVSLWKGHRLVCADATVLAPAQRACHYTRHLAAPQPARPGAVSGVVSENGKIYRDFPRSQVR